MEAIESAEISSGISLWRHTKKKLEVEAKFFKPTNKVFYYKEGLPDSEHASIKKHYDDVLNDIAFCESKIKALEYNVYVELPE